jgi:predicted dehydrogenase
MKVGVIGTGHWARTTHAPGAATAEGVELVGVWGRSADAARELAEKHGARGFDGVDELIAEVDALTFAVPPDVQVPIALQAARAGKHLLLEKPIALTVEDADALVAAVDEAGVSTLVFLTNRFTPGIADWIEESSTGQWDGSVSTWIGSALSNPDSPYNASEWRRTSGALWDVGPHALSMILPILGPVTGVEAVGGVRDLVSLVLAHESGALSSLTLTISSTVGAEIWDFRLWGPSGRSDRPSSRVPAEETLARALTELSGLAERGETHHPVDVRLGRDIVALLAEAEERIADHVGR